MAEYRRILLDGYPPTYFHKPVSSLCGHRARVVAPGALPVAELRRRDRHRRRTALPQHRPRRGRRLHRRLHGGERLRPARLPRHRRGLDAAGEGVGHSLPGGSGPGHRLGLPRQADQDVRERRGRAGREHRRDGVGHALPRRRHRPQHHARAVRPCCSPALPPTAGRSSRATWWRWRSRGSGGWRTRLCTVRPRSGRTPARSPPAPRRRCPPRLAGIGSSAGFGRRGGRGRSIIGAGWRSEAGTLRKAIPEIVGGSDGAAGVLETGAIGLTLSRAPHTAGGAGTAAMAEHSATDRTTPGNRENDSPYGCSLAPDYLRRIVRLEAMPGNASGADKSWVHRAHADAVRHLSSAKRR